MKILEENHQKKSQIFSFVFSQLALYLVQSKTYCFKSRINQIENGGWKDFYVNAK